MAVQSQYDGAMAHAYLHPAPSAHFDAPVGTTETEAQLATRVQAMVARSKADPRPSLTREDARRYLDQRLAPLLGKIPPDPH
jgi:hypothetical protein